MSRSWMISRRAAGCEVALAAVAVVADLLVPTIVLLLLATVSLAVRHERPASLGFVRPPRPRAMALHVMMAVVCWTFAQLALFMPLLEHLTGRRQDLSMFDDVEGNLGMLLGFLLLTWTIAAVGEEAAYRGFVQTRATQVFGPGQVGTAAAVGLAAVLFGLAHTEQGAIGVALTTLDAVFFSWLRLRHGSLWAAVLAHGVNNTIGLVAFYFVGPIHGLW